MISKESLKQKFNTVSKKRLSQVLNVSKQLNDLYAFFENTLKKQFQSFSILSLSICGAQRRNFVIDPTVEAAYIALSTAQKISYYELSIDCVIDRQKQTSLQYIAQAYEPQIQMFNIKMIKGLKIGQTLKLKIKEYVIDCIQFQVSLKKYILRKSKKNPLIFLLQNLQDQEPKTIRFQICDYNAIKQRVLEQTNKYWFSKWVIGLNKLQEKAKVNEIRLSKNINKDKTKHVKMNIQIDTNQDGSPNFRKKDTYNDQNINNKSVIVELIKDDEQHQIQEEIYEYIQRKNDQNQQIQSSYEAKKGKKNCKNIFGIIMPSYNLYQLDNYNDFLPVFKDQQRNIFIYGHFRKSNIFKMQIYYRFSPQTVMKHLCQLQNYKLWNSSINQSQIKLPITSDNTFIMYLKERSISQWYKERDFLFVKHAFKMGERYYMVDKSIQNSHFIPFQSIFRGTIEYSVARVEAISQQNSHFHNIIGSRNGNSQGSRLIMEINIEHGGLLNRQSKQQLTLNYLKQFVNLQNFITRFSGQLKNSCNIEWQIKDIYDSTNLNQNNASMESIASEMFDEPIQAFSRANCDQDQFYSIPDTETTPVHQITEEQLTKKHQIHQIKEYVNQHIQLTVEGYSILPKTYLKVKHPIQPFKMEEKRKKIDYDHIMLKKDFVINNGGGMKLVDQVKIAAQNNVIKFIMSTLKKNLFSGKGILNISLPVQIFNVDSNLQRLCESLAMAPDLIERKACKQTDPLQRFKYVIAFGLTNSILYFDIDKPFNPILGETFQGLIDGCPVYAQQTSHHPPISSILFVGRGYRIFCNNEAKVYVHINSGEGVNDGYYTIQFDDGGKILFQTAPGQVCGLAVGDRTYRIKGKMFVIDPKNRLYSAVGFQDESGIFSKNKWEKNDLIEGTIYRVTQSFIRKFFQNKQGIIPSKKDIQKEQGRINGCWLQRILINSIQYYNVKQLPYDMIHYEFPLNSNSDYREDLLYRKRNDLARSQIQKQRLEVLQRNDRKLREHYNPVKNH